MIQAKLDKISLINDHIKHAEDIIDKLNIAFKEAMSDNSVEIYVDIGIKKKLPEYAHFPKLYFTLLNGQDIELVPKIPENILLHSLDYKEIGSVIKILLDNQISKKTELESEAKKYIKK